MKAWAIALAALSLILLGVFKFKDPRVEATDGNIQVISNHVYFKGSPFSGIVIERNLHHDLLAEVHYKNGEREGLTRTYHHAGALVSQSIFHHGKKDGREDRWYVDGKHRSVAYFREGVAEDTYTEWHPNGRIYRQQKIVNGVEVENKRFYENGVIYSNYVVHAQRTYGVQGEPLCSAVKQEGFK